MKTLGDEVSRLRRELRTQAMKMDEAKAFKQDEDILEISRLARRIERGEFRHPTEEQLLAQYDLPEDVPPGRRHRSLKRGPLSLEEKLGALKSVYVDNEYQKDVAKKYRTSLLVVNKLVNTVAKRPAVLSELLDK